MTRLKQPSIYRTLSRLGALVSCVLLSGVMSSAQTPQADVNSVESVQTVQGFVEIELHSSRAFPVRDEVVVLRIGKKEFQRSRTPDDGSLKTLIFMLSPDEFESLADGEPMTVKYGRADNDEDGDVAVAAASAHRPRWDFGKLNKALHR